MVAEELWRPIPGAPNYDISSTGLVRAAGTHEPIKHTSNGVYRFVRVSLAGDPRRSHPIHSLVLLAFYGPRPTDIDGDPDVVVNHKDGDPRNNRPGNLEYTTNLANLVHGRMLRARKIPPGTPAADAVAMELRGKFIRQCCTVCLAKGTIPRKPAPWIEACPRCDFIARRCTSHGGMRRDDGKRLGAWHDLIDHADNHCAGYAARRQELANQRAMAQAIAESAGALLLGVSPL